ncbi:MAG: hypothetical protein ACRCTZ_04605 [Sarcina sp.]
MPKQLGDALVFQTVCHHAEPDMNDFKLYYYTESKRFHDYQQCGNMSIFDVIMRAKDISFKDACNYIEQELGNKRIPKHGIGKRIIKFKQVELDDIICEELQPIEKQFIYNIFRNTEIKEWCEEGISKEAMSKFNIRYDEVKNRAIIPHMNASGKLIGVRVRNFNYEDQLRGKYMPLFYNNKAYAHPLGQNLYGLNISKENIKKYKKAIITEGEKSPLRYESMYPGNNLSVAICGSSFSNTQKKMLLDLGVEEVILALDRQYLTEDSEEAIQWKRKIYKMAENLLPYCKVSYIWDTDEDRLLDYKDSPVDAGKTSFERLVRNRKVII